VQHIAVTVGPQDPPTAGEGSAEEARALAAALERTLPAREGIIRAIEVDPTLTARMEVRARDGVHALELVRSERPDVVVLDVMLPGLDGLEVCRRLRSFSDAYVLMLTARRGGRSGGGAIHRCRRLPDQAVLSARAGGARPRAAPQAAGHGDGWPAAAGSRRRHRPVSRPTR